MKYLRFKLGIILMLSLVTQTVSAGDWSVHKNVDEFTQTVSRIDLSHSSDPDLKFSAHENGSVTLSVRFDRIEDVSPHWTDTSHVPIEIIYDKNKPVSYSAKVLLGECESGRRVICSAYLYENSQIREILKDVYTSNSIRVRIGGKRVISLQTSGIKTRMDRFLEFADDGYSKFKAFIY